MLYYGLLSSYTLVTKIKRNLNTSLSINIHSILFENVRGSALESQFSYYSIFACGRPYSIVPLLSHRSNSFLCEIECKVEPLWDGRDREHLRQSNYAFPRHSRSCCDCFFTTDDVSDDKESRARWEVLTMTIRLRLGYAATWRTSARGSTTDGSSSLSRFVQIKFRSLFLRSHTLSRFSYYILRTKAKFSCSNLNKTMPIIVILQSEALHSLSLPFTFSAINTNIVCFCFQFIDRFESSSKPLVLFKRNPTELLAVRSVQRRVLFSASETDLLTDRRWSSSSGATILN